LELYTDRLKLLEQDLKDREWMRQHLNLRKQEQDALEEQYKVLLTCITMGNEQLKRESEQTGETLQRRAQHLSELEAQIENFGMKLQDSADKIEAVRNELDELEKQDAKLGEGRTAEFRTMLEARYADAKEQI